MTEPARLIRALRQEAGEWGVLAEAVAATQVSHAKPETRHKSL